MGLVLLVLFTTRYLTQSIDVTGVALYSQIVAAIGLVNGLFFVAAGNALIAYSARVAPESGLIQFYRRSVSFAAAWSIVTLFSLLWVLQVFFIKKNLESEIILAACFNCLVSGLLILTVMFLTTIGSNRQVAFILTVDSAGKLLTVILICNFISNSDPIFNVIFAPAIFSGVLLSAVLFYNRRIFFTSKAPEVTSQLKGQDVWSDLRTYNMIINLATAGYPLAERVIIGKFCSLQQLGLYYLYGQIAAMPFAIIYQAAAQIIYPSLARNYREGFLQQGSLLKKYLRLTSMVGVFTLAFAIALIFFGETLLHLVTGKPIHLNGFMIFFQTITVGSNAALLFAYTFCSLVESGRFAAKVKLAHSILVSITLLVATYYASLEIAVLGMAVFGLLFLGGFFLHYNNKESFQRST